MVSVQQVYEAISDGLIDVHKLEKTLQEQEEMARRREMLKCHKYAIIYDKRGDFYYTYLHDPTRKYNRRPVKRNNKVDLEDFLIEYYKAEEPEFFSFRKMYQDWIEIKKKKVQPATYDRYFHDYKRAFDGSEFEKMEIGKIDEYMIQEYISELIANKSYTQKSIGNVFTIISGVFKYAKSKHMTDLSISYVLGDIDKSMLQFAPTNKTRKAATFQRRDLVEILKTINNNAASKTMLDLGVELAFYTGLRVGELAALTIDDVQEDRICINKTEERQLIDGHISVFVKEGTKSTAGMREIALNSAAKKVIDEILAFERKTPYLFEFRGKRIRGHAFNKHLSVLCKRAGVQVLWFHCIRRYVASQLHVSGVADEEIRKIMGHSDIETTRRCYIKDISDLDNQKEALERNLIYI